MTRTDLLALTPDALAALANRGLVKRATKDIDAGIVPEMSLGQDGTVRGRFPDDVEARLPGGGGLEGASCTCAATGVCRHQIGLILAYQRQAAQAEPAGRSEWSPGAFGDDALVRVLGERAVAAARRTHRAGYSARIHRPAAGDSATSVELPTSTVRFLVPGELGYVHTDAAGAIRGEVIALAVWAFRAADEQGVQGEDVRVDVGGRSAGTAAGSGLEAALDLVDQVLLDGAMHAGPVLGTALRRAGQELTGRDLHWPAAALDDLAGQLAAYQDRTARYEPEHLAALLAEVHARHRAGRHDGGSPRSQVLGTNETAETPLRRVRLTALGCRIGGTGDERTADVFLAHAATGVVLVLKRHWEVAEGQTLTGHDLASRRISGSPLRAFATANVVSESASRSASRVIRLGAGRVAKTTVAPLGSAWEDLPGSVLVRDLGALGRGVGALPPRLIRPRVEAELVRIVEVTKVHDVGYHPGDQRLEAVITDAAGTTATVSAAYSPYRPGALECLAGTLSGQHGDPLFISGSVRRAQGTLMLDPIAVLATGGVIVPDLASGDGSAALEAHAVQRTDPLNAVVDDGLAACAEAAHRGLRHVPDGLRIRIGRAASELGRAGLHTAADLLTGLGVALGGDDTRQMIDAWVDARLRLMVTAELR
jgi:hypothetical protein